MSKAAVGALILFLLLAAAGFLPAQQEEIAVTRSVDWETGTLILDLSLPIDIRDLQPDSRFQAERKLANLLPALFVESVIPIPFDSYRTIGERIKEDQGLFQVLSDTALASVEKRQASLARDLEEVQVQYRFPFYGPGGLVGPLIAHSRARPLRRVIGFVPSRNFSGLVIYARGELPAHGKDIRQRVHPALFPKLYDEDMNLFLSVEMCDPTFLRRWGMAAYTYSEEEGPFQERIGTAPLRTVARGVFGINATDIIIPTEAVRRLLCREANQALLREGRILIIVDPP